MNLTPLTDADLETLAQQLNRVPRGIVGVAWRTPEGVPGVIATAPRLPDGTPFPTTFYLTHPVIVRGASRLEAGLAMAEFSEQLAADEDLRAAYTAAHHRYLEAREQVRQMAGLEPVPEIEGISAGGLPTRVKCLHALIGHALAEGPGVNPVGDRALAMLGEKFWAEEQA